MILKRTRPSSFAHAWWWEPLRYADLFFYFRRYTTPCMFAEWQPGGPYDVDSDQAHARYQLTKVAGGRRTVGGAKAPYALRNAWRFWR